MEPDDATTMSSNSFAQSAPARLPGVLIADDHRLLVDTLAALLGSEFTVLGCVANGEELIAAAGQVRPDIALIDIHMPGIGGLEAARVVRRVVPECRVVFLTAENAPAIAAEAFALGASGLIVKTDPADEVLRALRIVLQGGTYLSTSIAGGDPACLPPACAALADRLSPREREVLALAASGLRMKDIARRVGITPRTVAFHKYQGMAALGLRRQSDLVRFALDQDWLRREQ